MRCNRNNTTFNEFFFFDWKLLLSKPLSLSAFFKHPEIYQRCVAIVEWRTAIIGPQLSYTNLTNILDCEGFLLTIFLSNDPAIKANFIPSIDLTAQKNAASGCGHLNSHLLTLKWSQRGEFCVKRRRFSRDLHIYVTQKLFSKLFLRSSILMV